VHATVHALSLNYTVRHRHDERYPQSVPFCRGVYAPVGAKHYSWIDSGQFDARG